MKKVYLALIFLIFSFEIVKSQTIFSGMAVYEELLRREQLNGIINEKISFLFRPITWKAVSDTISLQSDSYLKLYHINDPKKSIHFEMLPIVQGSQFSSKMAKLGTDLFMPTRGLQTYFSPGIYGYLKFISIQFRPEHRWSNNRPFDTGRNKTVYTEYLERFGNEPINRIDWGQSNIRFNFGAFSAGLSTENIWWGPGVWNSMTFTNNALGFKHFTFNSSKPIQTFLGSFEGQMIIGRLDGSGQEGPLSNTLIDDWRYLNAITVTYSSKWIPKLFVGFSRTFQQYRQMRGDSFGDLFPIFDPFQKEVVGFDKDGEGRDQQATVFSRLIIPKAKMELYFEYGRRDHAFNWREAIINPEHARGYLFGFMKLIDLQNSQKIQIRSEVFQQQESINTIIRNGSFAGGINWAGHDPVNHGFTHKGQMLNTGFGPSSNAQTLEIAWVDKINKLGLRFDRVNRHQDVYNSLFEDPSEEGRWVDLNLTALCDWKFKNIVFSTQTSLSNSLNHQWDLLESSSIEYPKGKNLLSFHSQVSLIYLFDKGK